MIDVCPVGALLIKHSDLNQEFGSTNPTMHTETVKLQDVVVKQPFGCLETKFKRVRKKRCLP
jgi:NADH dehydrogenase/NADH:ubiquinone oxidoreductase subunit G